MTDLVLMDSTSARVLTDQIKVAVEATWELVKRAYVERAWAVLGYVSWDDYCTREFGTSRLRLPREERSEVVASLRESGLSNRAIASATGYDEKTIRNELAASGADNSAPVIVTDGKTYSPTQPARSTTVIRDEDGEETGRIIDDRNPNHMSDDEYDDMLADEAREEREDWEDEREIAPGLTANDLAELNVPPEQAKPRRRPLEEGFFDATTRLEKAVTSLKNLGNDDRLPRNKEQVARYRNDLLRAIDALQRVADQLT